jgi:hypothetical protein
MPPAISAICLKILIFFGYAWTTLFVMVHAKIIVPLALIIAIVAAIFVPETRSIVFYVLGMCSIVLIIWECNKDTIGDEK